MALLFEKRDGLAIQTLNRPEVRNALDPETIVELAEAQPSIALQGLCHLA